MRSQKQVHATMDEARRVVSNIAKLPTFFPRLKLEMQEGAIVISLPGTNYQVTYRRLADSPGMRASHNLTDDQDAPITPFEFLERAWIIARDKARELGWIV